MQRKNKLKYDRMTPGSRGKRMTNECDVYPAHIMGLSVTAQYNRLAR